jgi:predicted glycogen debranching enzyme
MSVRALLQLKKQVCSEAEDDAPLEWLVTNGLGGYAAGSVAGPPLRRFHGLLIAAHAAPAGRIMLLHALEESLQIEHRPAVRLRPLRTGEDAGLPAEFCLQGGLPRWNFELGPGLTLEQSVMMPHDQNTVHLRYRLAGSAAATLSLRPWLDFRPHEGRVSPEQTRVYAAGGAPARHEFGLQETRHVLRFRASDHEAQFVPGALDWNGVLYSIERERGYDHIGSAHSPGTLTVRLIPDRDLFVTASSEPWSVLDAVPPDAAWELEESRRERLLQASGPRLQASESFLLTLAADQFIVRPATRPLEAAQARAAGAEARTVIAGYPWFTDWGRDTMISLEGLTLVTGRHHEARDILRTFALHVHGGLIPNLFPEGERLGLYHTADATLWFFHALHRYDDVSGDRSLVTELLPTLEAIVKCHREGTSFNIRVDEDGLLTQGAEGLQLTWMDAKVDSWVVTPRRGKTVEINALWHNALKLLEGWLAREGRGLLAEAIAREARRCRESFNRRFWNPASQQLYDLVDGERGDDDACRPNQVIALAVAHSPLDRERWRPVIDTVAAELLTPVGLRTLSAKHPDFKPRYVGDLRARDAAYHQGTVWPWLLGPFVDAWLAVHPDDAEGARTLLSPLLRHLTSGGCAGTISEIFDAEAPYLPRGCVAQAWSVAELARALVKVAAVEERLAIPASGHEREGS